MKVQVSLTDGVPVGEVDITVDDPAEIAADTDMGDGDSSARAAAVAWHAIARNGMFTVNGKQFTADDCAEWWA